LVKEKKRKENDKLNSVLSKHFDRTLEKDYCEHCNECSCDDPRQRTKEPKNVETQHKEGI